MVVRCYIFTGHTIKVSFHSIAISLGSPSWTDMIETVLDMGRAPNLV
jgi:hypothetical protein